MGLRSFAYGAFASALYCKQIAANVCASATLTLCIVASGVLGQSTTAMIKEPVTGITFAAAVFDTATVPGGLTWGYALPPNAATADATEYIGYVVRA